MVPNRLCQLGIRDEVTLFNPIPVGLCKALYPHRLWEVPKTWNSGPWLTFDDGPDPIATPEVLGILEEFEVKAYFYCNGKQIERHPDLFRAILDAGHCVGNHGWDHLDGWNTSTRAYLENAIQNEHLVESNWYRPPYGRLTRSQERALTGRGYKIAMWSIMAEDWRDGESGLSCARRVLKHLGPQSIVVWHTNEKSRARVGVGLRHLLAETPYKFGMPKHTA